MANSLLAHLYTRIKGSQEDVATLSLQYIISQSPALNRDFTRLIGKALYEDIDTELNYVCQAAGDKLERPDIAGIDAAGKEHILCEAKFYAGLTANQPNAYLDRLKDEDGRGLVFICPAVRKVTLWARLLDLCRGRELVLNGEYCASVDNIRMSILTWAEIIESLRRTASLESPESLQDIYQLDGFCRMMDTEAFIPFTEEDFGPENAIREERHYQVIDAVFNKLMADKSLRSTAKGLRATPYRNGYVRYIRVLDYQLSIRYDRQLWRNSGSIETPFWVVITDDNFRQTEDFLKAHNMFEEAQKDVLNGSVALALSAPVNATLDEVAEDMTRQILVYIRKLEERVV